MAISLLAMFAVSCTNDDTEITKASPKHNVTLNVGTRGMYDEFGIADRVRDSYLRDGGRVIGITTFVYNSEGNLVDSQITSLSNFNLASQVFENLVEDDYTFVTIETLLNPDDEYKADDWTFDDTEKLSTLKISQASSITYYSSVLGVVITNVKLADDISLSATPKAIGSLVNYYPYDLEETGCVKFSFVTSDIVEYYSPNPQLQRNDKFHEDLTKKNYVNLRFRGNIENSTGYYWTFYLLESSIEWMPALQDEDQLQNGKLSTWSSQKTELEDGKTYYAGFYYIYSEGESRYAASYFGDQLSGLLGWASEWENWKKDNLNNSNSRIYTVPYTNWNVGTVSAVKSYMANFDLYQDIQYDDIYEAYSMTYFDDSFNMYDYVFKSSTTGLTDVYVWPSDNYTLAQVREQVEKQGYTYHSQNGNNYYYTSNSTYVTVYQSDSGWILVNYYDPKAYGGVAPQKAMPRSQVETKLQIRRTRYQDSQSRVMSSRALSPFVNNRSNVT